MPTTKALLFIPCYNCKSQILRVVTQLSNVIQASFDTIIFIDNGSNDNTIEQAMTAVEAIQKISKFVFLKNNENYGLGGSHKVAFQYARDHSFEFIGVLHGDDQADINDFSEEIKNLSDSDMDCILGARFLPNSKLVNYSRTRILGNQLFNYIFSALLGKKIYDLGSGLNFYRVAKLNEMNIKKFPDDLTFNYVFISAIIFCKLKIKFVPISWREQDQISNVRAFKQIKNLLGIILKIIIYRKKFVNLDQRIIKRSSYPSDIVKVIEPN